jgi:hypothetical protein
MEKVKEVKMSLRIETNQRTLEKEFTSLFDLKAFMDGFFSGVADRRSGKSNSQYNGPERRMQIQIQI